MSTLQSASIAPNTAEYAGDEIQALVLDPGFSSVRAGFAGEDSPKSVVSSCYGLLPSSDSSREPKILFGENNIHTPLPNLQIKNPMSAENWVDDWDAAIKLWEYSITSRLTNAKPTDPMHNGLNDPPDNDDDGDVDMTEAEETEKPLEENPLLMTEPSWNSGKAREKAIEIAMENWGCPAFWLARDGVLAAFAGGKSTALVIDIGASNITITPVHDGTVMRKGVLRSPLAGDWLSNQCRLLFSNSTPPITLTPHYLVTSKSPVDANEAAKATYRTFPEGQAPHQSFRRFEEERIIKDFKETIVHVWPGPGWLSTPQNEDAASSYPAKPFELPDGYNTIFSISRFKVAEGLFDPDQAYTPAVPASTSAPSTTTTAAATAVTSTTTNGTPANASVPNKQHTLNHLVSNSLAALDVDIRPNLLNNIVLCGGGSQLQGLPERLNQEIQTMFPNPRVRINAAGIGYERRFASWIGGSILSSLGTFHQMWISRKEYDENGANIVEKRCK